MPPTPIPPARSEEDDEGWFPFPHQTPIKRSLMGSRSCARAALWTIGNECVPLNRYFATKVGSPDHLDAALALYKRLCDWHDNLDSRLVTLYDAPPHLFQLL
jgi:hypothetical protein